MYIKKAVAAVTRASTLIPFEVFLNVGSVIANRLADFDEGYRQRSVTSWIASGIMASAASAFDLRFPNPNMLAPNRHVCTVHRACQLSQPLLAARKALDRSRSLARRRFQTYW